MSDKTNTFPNIASADSHETKADISADAELLEYSSLCIKAALEKLRYNLLDIGTRNRLISTPELTAYMVVP